MILSFDKEAMIENFINSEVEELQIPELDERDVENIRMRVLYIREEYKLYQAPVSTQIFDFIKQYGKGNISIELGDFKDPFDAAILSPSKKETDILIILNNNKPLVKQIFAAAHELYHYISDKESILKSPTQCNLAVLGDYNEKIASRFAAEFLLPQQALREEIERIQKEKYKNISKFTQIEIANFAIQLSLKYGIPSQASLMRMTEEGYIKNPKKILVKVSESLLSKLRTTEKWTILELIDTKNPYVIDEFTELVQELITDKKITHYQLLRDKDIIGISDNILSNDILYDDSDDEDDDFNELSEIVAKMGR